MNLKSVEQTFWFVPGSDLHGWDWPTPLTPNVLFPTVSQRVVCPLALSWWGSQISVSSCDWCVWVRPVASRRHRQLDTHVARHPPTASPRHHQVSLRTGQRRQHITLVTWVRPSGHWLRTMQARLAYSFNSVLRYVLIESSGSTWSVNLSSSYPVLCSPCAASIPCLHYILWSDHQVVLGLFLLPWLFMACLVKSVVAFLTVMAKLYPPFVNKISISIFLIMFYPSDVCF